MAAPYFPGVGETLPFVEDPLTVAVGNHSNTTSRPPITFLPTLPASVHTPVTITIAVVCLLMTLVLCFQLLRIHLYGYRRKTYYYACLWMSLAWGGLRTYLCFQYAVNRHVASSTAFGVYFILFVLPAVLQFGTFSLVTLYFSTVLHKTFSTHAQRVWQIASHVMWVAFNVGVLVISVYSAWKLNQEDDHPKEGNYFRLRVMATEFFSLVNVTVLFFIVLRIKSALLKSRSVLEGYGATIKQVIIFTVEIELLFLSRFIYNMVAIGTGNMETWGYRWTFLSDHADRKHDDGKGYIFFVMALFLWEIVPVFTIIWFFWVRKHASYQEITAGHRVGVTPKSVFYEDDSAAEEDDDFNATTNEYSDLMINGTPRRQTMTPYGSFGSTAHSVGLSSAPNSGPASLHRPGY